MSGREVWVTGAGAVTAVGCGVSPLRRAVEEGSSALRPCIELDGFPAGIAPEIAAPARPARHLDRSAALFFTAAEEAWRDAKLADDAVDPQRCAVVEGSSLGPLGGVLSALRARLAASDDATPRPTDLVRFMTGAGGAAVAQLHGLRGPVIHVSAGSVSATCAIGEGFEKIASGELDVVVAGGAECPLQRDIAERFRIAGILAACVDGSPPCRPFDARRNGTVLGEGAGVLVLEAADHAACRGARLRAAVRGYGLACEAFSMLSPDPDGTGVADAARTALRSLALEEIGWIKTHGTGTRRNDAAECRGLAAVFGARLPDVPLTSLKPALGHCLGASGAVEAVAALVALERGIVPATLGTEQIDSSLPPCAVATQVLRCDASSVLLLAESFGGRCAALTLSRS